MLPSVVRLGVSFGHWGEAMTGLDGDCREIVVAFYAAAGHIVAALRHDQKACTRPAVENGMSADLRCIIFALGVFFSPSG